MAASKFSPDTCQAIAELVFDGFTLKDACRTVEIREKTVKGWITRGRREDDGPYRDFVAALDEARQEAQGREEPLDAVELKLVVSKAAKQGSVQAMKLYWEMIRASSDDDEESDDPFARLDQEDEIAAKREQKKAS